MTGQTLNPITALAQDSQAQPLTMPEICLRRLELPEPVSPLDHAAFRRFCAKWGIAIKP